MRNLRIFQHISLDGVIQSPGSPAEDPGGGFSHGGWVDPYSDPSVRQIVVEVHNKPFDLLLGRHTYDIWSGYWPHAQGNVLAEGFNKARKFVVTNRPDSLNWGPAEGLGPDIGASVRALKKSEGPDIILWGSSTVSPVILSHGLADEIDLFVYPILLGSGKRLFSGDVPPQELVLRHSAASSSGILHKSFAPGGALRTGAFSMKST